ncbi:MAG: acyl-CoA thioesterase [Chromatiales bacterium]|jgi:acyl-CoA thioester hydrolase|nr:acyl-CoA thioesterase [Chromatiales bacterium]
MTEQQLALRSAFPHFLPIQTRWNDMDRYGHVNNMVFYGYFDTVVTDYIMRIGGMDPAVDMIGALVIESHCSYHRPIAFPSIVKAGLRVGKLGRSSVRYEIGIFADEDPAIAADGHFVHVYVDKTDMRPVPIPESIRAALEPLLVPQSSA